MIRYSELQIGDYCLVEGKIRRIESLTKRKIGFHINKEKKRLYYARLHDIEPIEINEYILRTSGFCVVETENITEATFDNDVFRISAFLHKGDGLCEIEVIHKKECNTLIWDLRYAHELQHAIRLCGIHFEIKL